MRRWPPVAWLAVYLGSVLILMGSRGHWALLAAGGALVVFAFAFALLEAVRSSSPDPRLPGSLWWLGGVAAFYVIAGAAAGAALGAGYAVAALAAGLIPATVVALVIATARRKSTSAGAEVRDAAAGDGDDALPGIGADTATALGDTSEHSDVLDDPGITPDGRVIPSSRARER
jgi:hypothetical protein